MAEHKLSYTASEIDERLGKVSSLVAKINGITPDSTGNVTLPIDTSIQQNSTNPVTGGALYNELSELAEDVRAYVEDNTPTKTSQLTNDSGFITGIPSEYITESELTAKGYATQTSVDALSNRIDNLPSGEGSSIIIDSEFSLTSTNPLQNKVVAEAFQNVQNEFEAIQNEIDNLSASGGTGSGKELLGEFTLTKDNLTSTDATGIYTISSDIQTVMSNVFSTLEDGYDVLVAELTLGDLLIVAPCKHFGGSTTLNIAQNIQVIVSTDTESGTIGQFAFTGHTIRCNTPIQTYVSYILAGNINMDVKFYKVSGGSGSSAQPDWDQNDSSASDYIKNRPFYKETEIIFDEDVTTVAQEDVMIMYEHPSSIIDLESVQDGDPFEVVFGDTTYLYEIKVDTPFLGNFYIFVEQQAAGANMTVEEYLDLISQHMPEIADLAVDTGENFIIMFNSASTLFLTKEAGTYHFTINGVTNVKKLASSMIDWAGGGAPSGLPEVTIEDNDKVLMVVDGKWVVGSIANGDEVAY